MEGLLESLETFELDEKAADAAQQAGGVATQTISEARAQARTPEGRELRHDVVQGADHVARKAGEAMEDLRETVEEASETVQDRFAMTAQELERRWEATQARVGHGAQRVEHAAEAVADETRARSQNLARAALRSRRAPGAIYRDVKQSVQARMKGVAVGTGLYAVAGVVALTGFIVLTVATVAGLNAVAGAPEGTFIAALLYLLVAVGVFYGGMLARRKAQERADQHMNDARIEVRNVTRPLRRAVATHRITPPREDLEPPQARQPAGRPQPRRGDSATSAYQGPETDGSKDPQTIGYDQWRER